ncbi:MAG TPA: hypothetical protein VF997_05370 [Polyangia bacterium]
MAEILSNQWFRLTVDDDVVRITRLAAPPPSPSEMAGLYGELIAALRGSRAKKALVDLRGGPPGRNDPEFERASEDWRKALAENLDRVAILVRTAVGKLHIHRLAREVGRAPAVFMDEAEALAFLRAP